MKQKHTLKDDSLYNGKYTLQFKPNGHKYLINGAEKQGVTSIIALLNKPNLPQWAASRTVDYILTHSEAPEGSSKDKRYIISETDLKAAKNAHITVRDESAILGKAVHAWIETHIKNKIDGKAVDPAKYAVELAPSIESFLRWEKDYSPQYLFSERIVYSEANDYCGTVDLCAEIKDHVGNAVRVVLDFKTGKPEREYNLRTRSYTGRKRPYNTVFIQTAMYDLALEEEDGIRADAYGALYISTNGDLLFSLNRQTDALRGAALALSKCFKALSIVDSVNEWM